MKTNIQVFKNEMFGEIRTLTNEKGETFFVGKDVATALGYSKPENAIAKHVDADDKSTTPIRGTAYETRAIVINESGLYALILSSKLDRAREFKHWVTSEVLPQIRLTGGYIPTQGTNGRRLTATEIVEKADSIMQRTIERKNLPADGCLTSTDIAKTMGMDATQLNHFLVDKGIIRWRGGRYHMTPEYANRGLDKVREHHAYSLNGRRKVKPYLVWTEMGLDFIRKLIN